MGMRRKEVGLGQQGCCFARGIETVCLQDSVTKHVDWCGWSQRLMKVLHLEKQGNIDGLKEVW